MTAAWTAPHAAYAQLVDRTEDTLPLPFTDDPSDPIGVDREPMLPRSAAIGSNTRSKTRASSTTRYDDEFGPEPPPLSVTTGEVLTAAQSLHESSHQLSVQLLEGLALVRAEIALENAGDKPAEVAYRLAVPGDAALVSFEVCNARGCRSGLPDPSRARWNAYDDAVQARGPAQTATSLPAGDARLVHDARGEALSLRAAPVSRSNALRMRVEYIALAPMHAGITRVAWPARGMDARAMPTRLSVHAAGHTDLRVNDLPVTADQALELDAWSPIELSAHAAESSGQAVFWKSACGRRTCLHAYLSARREQPAPRDIVLAIDASPSTEGSARSRLLVAVAALLSQAPPGSQVRAVRFAGRAAPLLRERSSAHEVALERFAPIAFEAELGSATRFEAAWSAIEQLGFAGGKSERMVVILGDGGLTTGPARPFEAALRKRVEVAVVNVADRPSQAALVRGALATGGAVLDVGAEAGLAVQTGRTERLEERLAAVFQPRRGSVRISGASDAQARGLEVRAGDSVTWQGTTVAAAQLHWGARTLTASHPPATLSHAIAAYGTRASGRLSGQETQLPALVAVDRSDLAHKPDRPVGQDQPGLRKSQCDRRGPARRTSGLSSDAAPVALAQERALCAAPPKTNAAQSIAGTSELAQGKGMPGSPLLSMLRQRILPVARGCFRRDRAGRADYQVRAIFEFELADREITWAHVQGAIAEPLRACLLASVDSLAVPPFTGRVVVRYPLITEREPLPSQIELTPQTASELDSVATGDP